MTTVGVLTPHLAPGPELEIPAMTSGRVTTVVARIAVRGGAPRELREGATASALEAAAASLPAGSVDALAYASTSAGYAVGARRERVLVDGLRDRWRRPVLSSGLAALAALEAFDLTDVTVVHPPWFDDDASALASRYFGDQGVDAVVVRADSLPADPAEVQAGQVVDWATDHLDARTEAVFFGGNGFRTAAAVEAIEGRTGALVLTANQVLLWAVLGETHTGGGITGYGRLFSERPPTTVRGLT